MFYKIVSITGILLLFTGCFEEEKVVEEKVKIKTVKIIDLNNVSGLRKSHSYPALIHSLQDSTMAFEVSGKITKFYYEEGDFVKKGSVVAKLDDTIYKANYNAALSDLKQSQIDYKRYKSLFATKSIAKRDLEKVKQELDLNRANFNIAKKRLEDAKLVAEFDGVMAKKLVNDFERITEKQPVIRLQDNSAYKVKFSVPENDILQSNQKLNKESIMKKLKFFVNVGNTDKKITAKFFDITTTAEEVSRTFEVTLKIDKQENQNILPGMTANVSVTKVGKVDTTIFVPINALFTDESRNAFVWTVDDKNIVHKQSVKTGNMLKDSIEIKEGLIKSSKVVTSGVRFLNENDKVKVYKKIGN